MTELEERLIRYSNAYYQGQELVPDSEYDALIKVLKEKQPDSELLKRGVIGSDAKGISKKYKLEITMGTLEKCNSDEELKDWMKKHPHDDIVAELKIDGCLDYETILDTDLGKLPIGKIVEEKIKCRVKTFNFEKNEVEMVPIDSFMINNNNFEWYELELENGTKIIATENHKFYLPEFKCFRALSKLKIGDELKIDNDF